MSRVVKQLKFLNRISFATKKPQVVADPEKYAALNLTFQWQNHNGHMGARKFWREFLPTLQFYNPDLKIQVTRIKNDNNKDASVPCTLEIVSKDGSVVDQLDMKNKDQNAIMDELLSKLEHTRVPERDLVKV